MSDETVVVVDLGSGFIKAGLGGQDAPSLVIPSVVGQTASGGAQYYVGDQLTGRSDLTLSHPIVNGQVQDPDALHALLDYVIAQLGVTPQECYLLLTEPPGDPATNQQTLYELAYDCGFQACSVQITSVLDLYADGRTTGLVVDLGDGAGTAVAVQQGYLKSNSVQRNIMSGQTLTSYLGPLVYAGTDLRPVAGELGSWTSLETLRQIKEGYCTVAPDAATASTTTGQQPVTLPDGSTVNVNSNALVHCPEALFQPALAGNGDFPGLAQSVLAAAGPAGGPGFDDLLGNIVLAGGTSNLPGLADRLTSELTALTSTPVNVIAPAERKYSAWIGASILSSLSNFTGWMTQEEWQQTNGS